MKLVILGAGASFDSIHQYYDGITENPWRPPLANELLDTRKSFRDIIEKYPGGRYYISQVNGISDVEAFFQDQWDIIRNNRADDLLANFINLQFCLQDLFYTISVEHLKKGLSNYDVLIQKAYDYSIEKGEEVIFITFNYDLLIESAFRKVYPHMGNLSMEDYFINPLKLFKLHGSCNWTKKFKLSFNFPQFHSLSNHLYLNKINLAQINASLENTFLSHDRPTQTIQEGPHTGLIKHFFPQILIPFKSKDHFILHEPHLQSLQEKIGSVDNILIIGWKGAEKSFLNLLQNHLGAKELNITSVNAGDKEIENIFEPILPNATFDHFNLPFSLTKTHNWKLPQESGSFIPTREHLLYKNGTFSSYILNLLDNKIVNFFS